MFFYLKRKKQKTTKSKSIRLIERDSLSVAVIYLKQHFSVVAVTLLPHQYQNKINDETKKSITKTNDIVLLLV